MKQFISSAIILINTLFAMSQTTNETTNAMYKKKLTPQRVEFVNTASISVTSSIVIDKPIEEVWSVIDDTPGYINWFPDVKLVKFVNPEETGLGAKRIAHARSFKYYEEIIAYEPMSNWGFTILESNSGIFTGIVEIMTLEKIGANQTKVIYQGGYEPYGFYKLMKGMIAKSTLKAWTAGLQSLKTYVEKR